MSSCIRILVLDDEADARDALATCLAREGYSVTACANSEEFWSALETSGADLVLLDVRMPGEDGYSVARRLRGEGAADIGIVMVSALGDVVDKVVGLEIGADDYLTKPFNCRELVARVRSVLRRHGDGENSPSARRKLDEIVSKLDELTEQVHRVDEDAHHIEAAVNATIRTTCPQCGSAVKYHTTQSGRLGICGACGWSHFVEG